MGETEIQIINWVPTSTCKSTPGTCTKEILKEYAVELEKEFLFAEEELHKEAFAAYYIYQVDKTKQTYNIAIYGNQVAAASSPNFGASMLQTIAQEVSGVPELQLELRNHMLPINNRLLPMYKPAVAEIFAVTACAAVIYLMLK